jgi:hypothetical protein
MDWNTEKIGNALVLAFFLSLTAVAFTYAVWAY